MFVFSWEGLILGVDLCDFYKLGASLPAALAGAFFPEKKPVLFFIYAKPCFFYDFFGMGLEKKASRLVQKMEKLRKRFWGDSFYDAKAKKWKTEN